MNDPLHCADHMVGMMQLGEALSYLLKEQQPYTYVPTELQPILDKLSENMYCNGYEQARKEMQDKLFDMQMGEYDHQKEKEAKLISVELLEKRNDI